MPGSGGIYPTLSRGCQELGVSGFSTMLLWGSTARLRLGIGKGSRPCCARVLICIALWGRGFLTGNCECRLFGGEGLRGSVVFSGVIREYE